MREEIEKLIRIILDKMNCYKIAIKVYLEENVVPYAIKHNKNMIKIDPTELMQSEYKELIRSLTIDFLKNNPQIIDLSPHSDSANFGDSTGEIIRAGYNKIMARIKYHLKKLKKGYNEKHIQAIIDILNASSFANEEYGKEFYTLTMQEHSNDKQKQKVRDKEGKIINEEAKVLKKNIAKELLYKISKIDFEYEYKILSILQDLKQMTYEQENG